MSVYPAATPEFRLLQMQDGNLVLQIRYVNSVVGYVSLWKNVPIVQHDTHTV